MEIFNLKCTNGLLKVYEDRVVISRNTVSGFLAQGIVGHKTFFYKDLSSIEYSKPSFWANGYMKFITSGTQETSQKVGTFGNTTANAAKDSNAIILRAFNKEIPNKSEEIYLYILQKISEIKKEGTLNNSNADEIVKFKQLLEEGVITQEEFESKKKQLLK